MIPALELVHKITALGGSIRVDGDSLVVAPKEAVTPFIDELRRHKPEFVALLRSQTQVPPEDPAAWRQSLSKWLAGSCAEHPRCSGGLAVFHREYSAWELAHDGVPCTRDTFIILLVERGFRITEAFGTALVHGVALCEDVDLHFHRPSTKRRAA
jgi:hypothetical protein